jgi:hypothetical protein
VHERELPRGVGSSYDDGVTPDGADLQVSQSISLSHEHVPLTTRHAAQECLPRRPADDSGERERGVRGLGRRGRGRSSVELRAIRYSCRMAVEAKRIAGRHGRCSRRERVGIDVTERSRCREQHVA